MLNREAGKEASRRRSDEIFMPAKAPRLSERASRFGLVYRLSVV
jgi:hypothetical protein